MRLYDLTHHTSGIIVFQSGLTQAFDWGYERRTAARQNGRTGVPSIRCDGRHLPA